MARVVIVGGGIVGAGVAYHLGVIHGWDNITVIDQGELPYNVGSTSHAPGGVVVASNSKLMADMAFYSSKLYSTLDPVDDKHINYFPVGGLELARTPERWQDLHRLHSSCTAFGYQTHLLTAKETVGYLDYMDHKALSGSLLVKDSALVRGYHIVGD
ncbi:MAG: FAD-binding oxidoreductase, partial [Acidimicrobiia bacterium]|nr:FAD-binding oxidoreductase [Acidimicrobiia bacterium]